MFLRKSLYTFLALAASMFVVPQVMAQMCLAYNGGSCVYWSGSVSCEDISAGGLGNVPTDGSYIVQCQVNPIYNPNTGQNEFSGQLFCANGGAKDGVGNVAALPQQYGFLENTPAVGSSTIPAYLVQNGVAKNLNAMAKFTDFLQLQGPIDACANAINKNWYPYDFVPEAMTVTVSVIDTSTGEIVNNNTETFGCEMPSMLTDPLKWDKKAGTPERRQFTCNPQ